MARILVLSKQEAKEFDEPPIFDSFDRKRFYDLSIALNNIITTLQTPENKVLFFVSYAYFKARKRFYIENSVYTIAALDSIVRS